MARRPTLTASARAGVRNLRSGRKKACGAVEQKKAQKQGRKRPQKSGLTVPRSYKPHSACGSAGAPPTAISCLGAFWTPAASVGGGLVIAGVQKPAQTRPWRHVPVES